MKTKIANLVFKNGVAVEENVELVDFSKVKSKDPIAFIFGQRDKKSGIKLPSINSKEYKELAKEYIRGFNSVKE